MVRSQKALRIIRRPDTAIHTNKGRTGALVTTKAKRAVEQTIHKPLEADGRLVKLASKDACPVTILPRNSRLFKSRGAMEISFAFRHTSLCRSTHRSPVR
jgi:hypothetical protein